ncbi:hypothetical protein B1218_37900, partial [Pseudomonas ogarae]
MKAHCANAQALAARLEQPGGTEKVHHAGPTNHPQHDPAFRQQRGSGAPLSFEVTAGTDGARAGAAGRTQCTLAGAARGGGSGHPGALRGYRRVPCAYQSARTTVGRLFFPAVDR